jgi:hypothetical protein
MNPFGSQVVVCLAAFVLAGCGATEQERRHEVAAIAAVHKSELSHFEEARDEFARRHPMPKTLDLRDSGTLIVHECALQGYSEHEELWVKYTWVNSTHHDVGPVHVTISLRDPSSQQSRSETVALDPILRSRFGPDCSYTTFLRLPLSGMKYGPDLEWSIDARTR